MGGIGTVAEKAQRTTTRHKLSRNLAQQAMKLLRSPLAKNVFSQLARGEIAGLLSEPTVKLLRNVLSNKKSGHSLNVTSLNLREENQITAETLHKVVQSFRNQTNVKFTVTFSQGSGYQIALTGETREELALPSTQEESAARQSQLGIETPPLSGTRSVLAEVIKTGLTLATTMPTDHMDAVNLALSPGATAALKISLGVEVPRAAKWLFRQFVIIHAPEEPTTNPEPATA